MEESVHAIHFLAEKYVFLFTRIAPVQRRKINVNASQHTQLLNARPPMPERIRSTL